MTNYEYYKRIYTRKQAVKRRRREAVRNAVVNLLKGVLTALSLIATVQLFIKVLTYAIIIENAL